MIFCSRFKGKVGMKDWMKARDVWCIHYVVVKKKKIIQNFEIDILKEYCFKLPLNLKWQSQIGLFKTFCFDHSFTPSQHSKLRNRYTFLFQGSLNDRVYFWSKNIIRKLFYFVFLMIYIYLSWRNKVNVSH